MPADISDYAVLITSGTISNYPEVSEARELVQEHILRLAISTFAGDLLILFVIILLCVLMNFFLEHEIKTIRAYDIIHALDEREAETDKVLINSLD